MLNVLVNLTNGGSNAESNALNKLARTVCLWEGSKINLHLIVDSLRDGGEVYIFGRAGDRTQYTDLKETEQLNTKRRTQACRRHISQYIMQHSSPQDTVHYRTQYTGLQKTDRSNTQRRILACRR